MAVSASSWESLLRTPFPCDHLVQVYREDDTLIRALAHFVASGVEQGEAAVVVATAEHLTALTARLAATGAATSDASGALVAIDARHCLDQFMVNDMPDRDRFRAVVTPVLDRLREAGYKQIRLFGEMVDLLWPQRHRATLRLEELWNEVLAEYEVCLLCAYRCDPFAAEVTGGALLLEIERCHSHVFSDAAEPV